MPSRPGHEVRQRPQAPSGPVTSVLTCRPRTEQAALREDGYLSATATDVDRMPPGIAAAAITAFSRPGDWVCDPDCGAGTVLVEALRAQRHALGRPRGRGWRGLARGNITAAQRAGALADGMLLSSHSPGWSRARTAGIAGQVRLVLTALRVHSNPASAVGVDAGVTRVAVALARVVPLLHPDGHVIITVPPVLHSDGTVPDTAGPLLTATHELGLIAVGRCVAVTAHVRGDRLYTRAGLDERRAAHRAHRAGRTVCLAAHHDVWIFQPQHGVATHPGPANPMRLDLGPTPPPEPTGSIGLAGAGRRAAS